MFKTLLFVLATLFAAHPAVACGFDSVLPLSVETHPHSPNNALSMFARNYWRIDRSVIDVRGGAKVSPPKRSGWFRRRTQK